MTYFIGVALAICAGITNFTGPLLQKKAINELKREKQVVLIKDLVRKPIWVIGLLLVCVVNVALIALAQSLIGAALIPGLTASGFIVLALGSSKILGEELKKQEYVAIGLLIVGVILVTMSKLSIQGDLQRFNHTDFNIRIVAFSLLFLALWFICYFVGKKKKKAIFMSFGIGFPFILSNIWVQPLLLSAQAVLAGRDIPLSLYVLFPAAIVVILSNFLGIIHMQHTMAEANASIVIPIQQVPQQISPIIIFFFIYALPSPGVMSYVFISIGISVIIFAGFVLSKRQTQIDKMLKRQQE